MMRIKLTVVLFLTLSLNSIKAHQPDLSSLTLVKSEHGIWMLQLNASMTAFQYAVQEAYGENSYSSPDEFNQQLLTLLKQRISLVVNDSTVTFGKGMVHMGHDTTVDFEVVGIPAALTTVKVKHQGFVFIPRSQVLFSVVEEGLYPTHFTLNAANDYQMHLTKKNSQMIIQEDRKISIGLISLLSVLTLLFIGVLLFYTKRRRSGTLRITT